MKSAIIDHIREERGVTKAEAEAFFDSTVAAIKAVAAGEHGKATVPGLGTFKFKDRAAREVRNPATGEMMTSAAKTVLTFKPAKGV